MRALLKPSVSMRLMAVLGIALITTALTGSIGSLGTARTEDGLNTLLVHLDGLDAVKQAHIEVLRAIIAEHETFRAADEADHKKKADATIATVDALAPLLARAEKSLVKDSTRETLKGVRDDIPGWRTAVAALVNAGGDADLVELLAQADSRAAKIEASLVNLTQAKREVAASAADEAVVAGHRSRVQIVIAALAGSVICLIIGMMIARGIINPLRQAIRVLEVVAGGDFTQRLDLKRSDELGKMADAVNSAVDSMHRALRDVRESASAVAVASRELSSAGDQISAGAQAQASSLQQTSASLAEMTSTVKQNADNAQQASQVAKNARNVAEQGGQVVTNAVSAMAEINASSKRIVDIITAIDEIAFQTNLLALNAAVEAARAGEQGRGFAVVAGEVRSLAQRSATSAKEIKTLIKDSVSKVENGSTLVHRSGETLREIVVAVERMSVIVDEIAAASREQSSGIDQLNRAVGQMDNVTQSNAAQTEELAGTAQSMSGQAEQLQDLVSRFKLRENDGQAKAPAGDRMYEARYVERSAPARRAAGSNVPAVRQAHNDAQGQDGEALDLGVLPESTQRDNRNEREFLEF